MSEGDLFYIVGHRGTGKSTAGRRAAEQLGWSVVDLDDVIEEAEGASCAEIIAESEARFRELERSYRRRVVEDMTDGPSLVILGGGFHPIPDDGVVVWLHRDGWVESARRGREQLDPEREFEAEIAAMIDEREPRWETTSHLRLNVPRGRGPERVARDLATHIEWLNGMSESPLTQRTWVVAGRSDELERAARQAELLGLAGVEVRSDLLGSVDASSMAAPVLASLRGDDFDWMQEVARSGAAMLDVDLSRFDALMEAGVLDELEPRPFVLSSHPERVERQATRRFAGALDALRECGHGWAEEAIVKYAPQIDEIGDLNRAVDVWAELRRRFPRVTFLVQGEEYAWTRPPMARHNATNYVPVGLASRRREQTEREGQTPWDLQDWLPHLTEPVPDLYDGLVGTPVRDSQGDVWHRRVGGSRTSYLKIPAAGSDDDVYLETMLDVLGRFPIRGLSVTSPLKRRVVGLATVSNPSTLEAGNTLRRVCETKESEARWELSDTDEEGMRASLESVQAAGFGPGTIAVIGTGGVAPAVVRAIEASDWRLVHHARGREGWRRDAPEEVTMVVNAVGDRANAYRSPPDAEVWLDLHYADVGPAPGRTRLHLNGDTFFDAQARAQREIWSISEPVVPDEFETS